MNQFIMRQASRVEETTGIESEITINIADCKFAASFWSVFSEKDTICCGVTD